MKSLLFVFWTVILLLVSDIASAQITPFGLQNDTIVVLTAERTDYRPGGYDFINGLSVFAGTTHQGVYRLNAYDTLAAWKSIGLTGQKISAMTVQHWGYGPRDGIYLFAATTPVGDDTSAHIYRYAETMSGPSDTGWARADSGLTTWSVRALAAWYFSGQTAPQPVIAGLGYGGLYRAGAGGIFWEYRSPDPSVRIYNLDVHPLWFGNLAWGIGIWGCFQHAFRSTDKGSTWETVPGAYGNTILIHPRNPDTVYCGSVEGYYKTIDGGRTWSFSQIRKRRFTIHALCADPQFPENLFAGGSDSTNSFLLYASHDGGNNWSEILPPPGQRLSRVTSLLFVSADSIYPRKERLAILFIGTEGTGVWKLAADMLLSNERVGTVGNDLRLESYPNPATGIMTVTIDLPRRAFAGLRLLDILGRERLNLHEGMLEAGKHAFRAEPGTLPNGVYFYELTAGGRSLCRLVRIVR